jgi:hypothetical protein
MKDYNYDDYDYTNIEDEYIKETFKNFKIYYLVIFTQYDDNYKNIEDNQYYTLCETKEEAYKKSCSYLLNNIDDYLDNEEIVVLKEIENDLKEIKKLIGKIHCEYVDVKMDVKTRILTIKKLE